MIVKVTKNSLIYNYLLWLDPILKLTKVERNVLASLVTAHYLNRGVSDIDTIVVSEDFLDNVRTKLRLGKKVFNEALIKLRQKGYITDNGVAPMFTSYPSDGKFIINIEFVLK